MNKIFYLYKVEKVESPCDGLLYLCAYYSNGEKDSIERFKYNEDIPSIITPKD
jgi:hypothetical protein